MKKGYVIIRVSEEFSSSIFPRGCHFLFFVFVSLNLPIWAFAINGTLKFHYKLHSSGLSCSFLYLKNKSPTSLIFSHEAAQ